ncbi:MAG: hypothetical protein M3018_07360, partial [Actinomycetota bacterium]|nr:hypothetical protein [Actinomycetota bacterium]
VLAVLGVADAEQLFAAIEAIAARDPAGAVRVAAALTDGGRDPSQLLRDLEVHGRELLVVQVLGEVPAELRVTPERDQRLFQQANALTSADAVRLLDLIAQALDATANGAQARIQLELVLMKAAAPELDPSVATLQSRIERLEAALAHGVADTPGSAREATKPIGRTEPDGSSAPAAPARSRVAHSGSAPQVARQLEPDPETEPDALDLDAARALWPSVVELVRAENAMLAALLADARPVAVGERGLTLAFPGGAAFLKRKAEQDEHRRVAAEALASLTGHRVMLRYELRDIAEEDTSPVLSGEELVRRFLEEFDAEEILDEQGESETTTRTT